MPLDFLKNIGKNLIDYFQPALNTVKNPIEQFFEPKTWVLTKDNATQIPTKQLNSFQQAPAQSPTPVPTTSPIPTATPRPNVTEQSLSQGFNNAGFGDAPIVQYSPLLAQAGTQLSQTVDPYLPAILSLMETGGLQNAKQKNNPYNIFYPGTQNPVDYQSVYDALFGPQGSNETLNLLGLLRQGGPYQDYLNSGNLEDFFKIFTPSSDPNNPSLEELINRYNTLRANFVGGDING